MDTPQVLLVEDDTSLSNLIAHALEREGFEVTITDSSVDAIMHMQRERFDAVLLDIMLNGSSGLYVVDAVRDIPSYERPKIVIITGAKSNLLTNLDRSVVKAVMFKPLDVAAVAAFVKSLVRSGAPASG